VRSPDELLLFGPGKARGTDNGPASGPTQLFSWPEYKAFRKSSAVFDDILAIDSMTNAGLRGCRRRA